MWPVLKLLLPFVVFYPFAVWLLLFAMRPVVVAALVCKKQNHIPAPLFAGLNYVAHTVAVVFAAVVPLELAVFFAALV